MSEKKYLSFPPDEVPDYYTLKQKNNDEVLALFEEKMSIQQFNIFDGYLLGLTHMNPMSNWSFDIFTERIRGFYGLCQDSMIREIIEEFIDKGNIII